MTHNTDPYFVSFRVVGPGFATDEGERQTVDLDITQSFASSPGGYFGNLTLHVGKWYLQPRFLIRSLGRRANHTAINMQKRLKKQTVVLVVSQGNLVLSTGLIMRVVHGKEIRKLMFRALALRRAAGVHCVDKSCTYLIYRIAPVYM